MWCRRKISLEVFFLAASVAFIVNGSLADEPDCTEKATECLRYTNDGDDLIEILGYTDYDDARDRIAISLFFHLIEDSSEETWSVADLDTLVSVVNSVYTPHEIEFFVVGVDTHSVNHSYLYMCPPIRLGDMDETRINVHLTKTPFSGRAAWDPYVLRANSGVGTYCEKPSPYILAHELGHALGLQHSHHQSMSTLAPVPCGYVDFNLEPPDSTGYLCGDWIPDNGALPNGVNHSRVDPTTCDWYSPESLWWSSTDSLLVAATIAQAEPHDIMGYYDDDCAISDNEHCAFNMTPEQAKRIKVNVEFNRQDYGLQEYDPQEELGYIFWGAIYPAERITFPDPDGELAVGEQLMWTTDLYLFDGHGVVDSVSVVVRDESMDVVYESAGYIPTESPFTAWSPTLGDVGEEMTAEVTFKNRYSPYTHSESLTFTVVGQAVAFSNRSDDSQIGDSFTDQPYDAKAIDYDDDGRPDLLISNDSGSGVLFRNQLHENPDLRDVPQFVNRTNVGFATGKQPSNSRGIALADIENDGDLDAFFAAEDTASVRLYQLQTSSPWFKDRSWSTSIGSTPALKLLAEDTWTATWGDVDRDGRVDLFLGRGGTSGGEPSGALADILLRNVSKNASTIRFSDISSTAQINSAGNRTTVTASFGELEGDKEPVLFVGDAGTAGSVLYRLASFNSSGLPVYDYEDSGSSPNLPSISPDDYEETSGSTWADMDNDGDLDLIVTKNVSSGNNTVILWGDGEGDFTGTPKKLASGFAISTPLVADLDFSGSLDLLLAPAVDDSLVMLLSNFNPTQHASGFANVTHHVGLDDGDGKITGIVAADFSGAGGDLDGDFDLYLGRTATAPDENPSTNTSSVYYRSGEGTQSSNDAPHHRWLGIRPRWPAGTGVEWSAIGTIVAIDLPAGTSSPALTTAKIVPSDGNRASETLGEVRFGLGTAEGPATILIRWPDGKEQTEVIDDADFNQTHIIDAAHHPDVVQESPSEGFNPTATYEVLGIGQAKWVITWYTEHACDPTLDQAVVERTSGSCTSSKTLTPTTSGVTHSVVPVTGGRYKHKMTYQTATCGPCTYHVEVTSKVSTREDTGETTLTMSTCGQFEG